MTDFAAPPSAGAPLPPAPPPPPPTLGPRAAIAAVVLYLSAQFLVGVVIAIRILARIGLTAPRAVFDAEAAREGLTLYPLSAAAGALSLALLLRYFRRRYPPEEFREGVGLRWGSAKENAVGFSAGVVLSLVVPFLTLLSSGHPNLNAFQTMALSGGSPGRLAWVATALLVPPGEEILFRGIGLRGLRKVVSLPIAGLVTGFAFWLLHWSEVTSYWPAAVCIAALAALATILRVRSGALGPAILAHLGYNSVIAAMLILSS